MVNQALGVLQDTTGSPLSFQPLATLLPLHTKNTNVFITVILVSTTKHGGTSTLTRRLVMVGSELVPKTSSTVPVVDGMDMTTD